MAREMKDSGIEWIGEIPKEWEIIKLKYVSYLNPKIDIKNIKEDTEVTFTPMDKIKNGYFINNKSIWKNNNSSYTNYSENDIVMAKVTPCFENGNIAIMNRLYNNIGFGSSELFVFRNKNNIKNKYLFYFLRNEMFKKLGKISMTGAGGLKRISSEFILNFKLFLPPLEEQEKIANYLDKKVDDIDLIIEKTKATIEDYKKYKQSIITETVTKGLNPNVEMKDSEIEWIGQIPKQWTLKKFKNILIERNEKNIPIKTSERLSLSIDKGVTLYSEKTTNLDRFKEDVSQYKIAHINDLVLNSMNMIVGAVGVSKYFGCVSPVYYTYYDKIKNSPTPKFCNYLFSSKTIKKVLFSLGRGIMAIDRGDDKINTCRLKVSRDDLRSLIFPIPSLEEQQQIVDYLDKKVSEIDNLISKKESLISEMEEYKKSLIYECVTGKKEVI